MATCLCRRYRYSFVQLLAAEAEAEDKAASSHHVGQPIISGLHTPCTVTLFVHLRQLNPPCLSYTAPVGLWPRWCYCVWEGAIGVLEYCFPFCTTRVQERRDTYMDRPTTGTCGLSPPRSGRNLGQHAHRRQVRELHFPTFSVSWTWEHSLRLRMTGPS